MSSKTPVRATFSGSNVTGLAEYQSGEFVPLTHGGLGASLSIGSAGQVLKVNGAGNAIEFGAVEAIVNIDNATDLESATLAVGDKILLSDGGTEGRVLLSQLDTLFSGTTKTLTNKTLTSPVLNTAVSGSAILDEDNMASDSATQLATQQSIKAYVDAQITAEDLDVTTDSGTIAIDLDSETLTVTGGTGIDSSATGNAVTLAIDSTVATLTGSQTLTNKTLTTPVIAEIDATGDFTLDAVGDISLDADGGNIYFKDAGASIFSLNNVSQDVVLKSEVNDKDIIFQGVDNSSAITALTLDMSAAGAATFNDEIILGANKKIKFGTADENINGDGSSVLNINSGGAINIAGNHANITSSSTTITNFSSQGSKLLVIGNSSQSVTIETDVQDKDLIFKGNDGGSVITALTLDMSGAGAATFNSTVTASGFVGNVTGNVSGSSGSTTGNAATATALETARTIAGQSFDGTGNITIASTDLSNTAAIALLTASQTLTNKTLTTPVIAEIDATGGFKIDAVGDIQLDAGGADIEFLDDDTSFLKISNSSSDVHIRSIVQDKDILFRGNDGGSQITALTLDMSEAGAASFNSNVTVGGNAVVTGNLTVNGTTTTLATTNSTITDRLIELGNGTTGTPGNDMGLVFERGDSDNAFVGWDESTDKFIVGTGTFTGASTGDLTITTGTLVANLEGNVTGNVTGNADTATALANARTIAGQSFDGTGNITIASTDLSNTSAITLLTSTQTLTNKTLTSPEIDTITRTGNFTLDVSGDIILDADGTNIQIKDGGSEVIRLSMDGGGPNFYVPQEGKNFKITGNDGGSTITALDIQIGNAGAATFNSTVTASGFVGDVTGNADTATTLANARTIAGQSFDGSANITIASTDLSNTSAITLLTSTQTLTNKTLTTPVIEEIDSSNDITLDAAGKIVLDADTGSNGVQLKDGGTEYMRFSSNGIHSNMYLPQEDGDLAIQLNDGGSTITALSFDASHSGNAHFNNNVSMGGTLTFEGATADGNETTLTVVDPTADRTITFQNASGTVAFLTDVTGGATPGNFTTITLDNNITFEGATDDAHETTLTVADPTADRTVTIPDATGTIVLKDTTDTLTNKTLTSPVIAAITSTADIDLTATNDVNIPANVGLTFGDDGEKIEGNGTLLTIASSNNLVLDVANDILLDAGNGAWYFNDDGTTIGSFTNSSSDFVLKSNVSDKDLIFKGNDGGSEVTALTLDMSDAGAATFNSNVAIGGNATVTGNLTVNGTTTTLATTNSVISDRLIELGNGTTGTPGNDMGIVLERGDSDNAFIGWDESADKFIVGTGSFTGASTGNLTITTGTLVANLEGNVTGNVTGNADTATALANARTIAGQSFDGTGNITIASTDLSNTSAITLLTASQTLTNKTLTSPTINGATFGAADVTFDSGTLFIDESADKIGINTTSPAAPLHVNDSGGGFARFTRTGFSGYLQLSTSGGDGSITVDGNNSLNIRTNGNIGLSIDGSGNTAIPTGTFTANNGVVVDNITIDGTEIDLSSGDLTVDVAGDIILDADDADIILKDGGTEFGRFTQASSDFYIKSAVSDKDIIFQGNDGGSAITALTLDMSDGGTAIFNKDIKLGDSKNIEIGASGDLRLYHDGSNSYIDDVGTGALIARGSAINIQSDSLNLKNYAGDESYLVGTADGAVEIRYDNSKKFETTSAGATVTGVLTADGVTLGANESLILGDAGETIAGDGTDLLITSSAKVDVRLGSANPTVAFYSDGTQFGHIKRNSGNFDFRASESDADITFRGNDGGSAITALTLDMSEGGAATFNDHVSLGSGKELKFHTAGDNIAFDGTNLLITATNGLILDGDQQILLNDGGVNYAAFVSSSTRFTLHSQTSDKDFAINVNDGGSQLDALVFDASAAGAATFNAGVTATSLTLNTTGTGDTLLLTATENSSTASPVITLKRNSGSVADADYLGQLKFKGENDNDEEITYAKVTGKILDASDGTEDGLLEFANIKAGSQTITARLRSDSLQLLNGTSLSVAGDATITGDLTVNGTTTTVSTTNTVVSDSLLELGNGTSGTPSNDAGIVIERGSADNAFIGYDESDDKFKVGTGSFTGSSTGNLTVATGTLVANIEGNVTGNVTGSSGSTTGNAATATALETARNIAGQSFDGTGNITIASTDLSDTSSIALLTSSQTLTNKTIDSDNNTITNIVNADIKSSAAIAFSKMADLTASRALVSDGSGDVSVSDVTSTELGYLDGVSSAIQTQLDNKATKGFAIAMAIAL